MKWIFAKERTPDNNYLVHIEYNIARTVFKTTGYYENDEWLNQYGDSIPEYNIRWLDEADSAQSMPDVQRDEFAISFCTWYSYAEDAQVYKEQKLPATKMLELFKSRPYLKTDSPQSN